MTEGLQGGTVYCRGLNWIGDAVLSLGALQGLKRDRPGIHVTVGAPSATAGVYRLSGAVDSVIAPPSLLSGIRFDAAVILPRSFRRAWESVFLSERRIGFASEGRSLLLTDTLDYRRWKERGLHQSTYYESLLQALAPETRFEPPRFVFSDGALAEARQRLRGLVPEGDRVLAVNPGAFYGRAKTWPTHHFVRLLELLLPEDAGLHAILFSGAADRPLAQEILRRLPHPRLHSVAGTLSLEESAALLSLCDALVTNDSGMMHLGSAAGRPGVALFGPTDPVATGPVSPSTGPGIRVLSVPTACAPCFLRECPIDHRCMERLLPETVLAGIIRILKGEVLL